MMFFLKLILMKSLVCSEKIIFLFIFKIINSYLEANGYVRDDSETTQTDSNTAGSTVATSYFEGG